jgi:hypothetical protein
VLCFQDVQHSSHVLHMGTVVKSQGQDLHMFRVKHRSTAMMLVVVIHAWASHHTAAVTTSRPAWKMYKKSGSFENVQHGSHVPHMGAVIKGQGQNLFMWKGQCHAHSMSCALRIIWTSRPAQQACASHTRTCDVRWGGGGVGWGEGGETQNQVRCYVDQQHADGSTAWLGCNATIQQLHPQPVHVEGAVPCRKYVMRGEMWLKWGWDASAHMCSALRLSSTAFMCFTWGPSSKVSARTCAWGTDVHERVRYA